MYSVCDSYPVTVQVTLFASAVRDTCVAYAKTAGLMMSIVSCDIINDRGGIPGCIITLNSHPKARKHIIEITKHGLELATLLTTLGRAHTATVTNRETVYHVQGRSDVH